MDRTGKERRIAIAALAGAVVLLSSGAVRGQDKNTIPDDIYYARWMSRSLDLKLSVGASAIIGSIYSNYPNGYVEAQASYKFHERISVGLANVVLLNVVDEMRDGEADEGILVQNTIGPNIKVHFSGQSHELWLQFGLGYSFFKIWHFSGGSAETHGVSPMLGLGMVFYTGSTSSVGVELNVIKPFYMDHSGTMIITKDMRWERQEPEMEPGLVMVAIMLGASFNYYLFL